MDATAATRDVPIIFLATGFLIASAVFLVLSNPSIPKRWSNVVEGIKGNALDEEDDDDYSDEIFEEYESDCTDASRTSEEHLGEYVSVDETGEEIEEEIEEDIPCF